MKALETLGLLELPAADLVQHQQGVHFKSLTDAIETGTTGVRFAFHGMASLAEMERELAGERTRTGLEVAR